jgi:HlyD family secretion protein
MEFRLEPVTRGSITKSVLASGTLKAVVTVDIGTQVSGMIKSLSADFNSEVKTGQVIARIDSAPFEARLTQAEAELAVARAQVTIQNALLAELEANLVGHRAVLVEAQKELARKRKLHTRGGIPESSVDTAQSTHEQSEATVKAGQAQLARQRAQIELAQAQVMQKTSVLQQRQLDLEYTFIRSSVDGVVISRNVDAGQTVAASLQTPVLFRIAQDLSQMEVYISVDEADIGWVEVGQKALFTVDSFPSRSFQGHVHQIRKVGRELSNVVTYTVVATAENRDQSLLPGMTANVNIIVNEDSDVIKVPNSALYFSPPDSVGAPLLSGSHVWVVGDSGKPRPVPIVLGISDGIDSEIVGGELQEGDKIINATAPQLSAES